MPLRWCLLSLALAAVISFTAPAQAASPFAKLAGSWSGTGSVLFEGGQSERLRCTARYSSSNGNTRLGIAIRCASTSSSIDLSGSLTDRAGRVSGSWVERSFNAEGTAFGRATASSIILRLGGSVTGAMSVSVSGSRQSVSVSTQGIPLRSIRMALRRR
jgi:hypothetical protein